MSFLEEILVGLLQESIFPIIKAMGASIRWLFYLGKQPINKILKQEWNTRIGLAVVLLMVVVIYKLLS